MGIVGSLTLYSATGVTASATGTSYTFGPKARSYLATITATNNSGTTPTLDAKIQHSTGNGTWFDLVTFSQQTTGGPTSEAIHITNVDTVVLPLLRAVTTLAGTNPNYDVSIVIHGQD